MTDQFAPLLCNPVLPGGKSNRKLALDNSPAADDSSLSSFEFKLQEIQGERVKEAIEKSTSMRQLDNSFTFLAAVASTKTIDLVLDHVEEVVVVPPAPTTVTNRGLIRPHNSMSMVVSCDAAVEDPKPRPSLSYQTASTRRSTRRASSVANLNPTITSGRTPVQVHAPVIQDPRPRRSSVGGMTMTAAGMTSSSRFRGNMQRLGRAMQRKATSQRIFRSGPNRIDT